MKVFTGLCLGWLLCMSLVLYSNNNFEYSEKRRAEMIKLCAKMDSIPRSYDFSGELVCANGQVLIYEV